jgi:hypothetical protein
MSYSPDHDLNEIRLSGQIGIISAVLALVLLFIPHGPNPDQPGIPVGQIQNTVPSLAVPTISSDATNNHPVDSITPSVTKLIADDGNQDRWFPSPLDISTGLTTSNNIKKIVNEELARELGHPEYLQEYEKWGRKIAYSKEYTHPKGCASNNLKDAYVEIIFFKSSEGPKGFFEAASTVSGVELIESVGERAYVYKTSVPENNCQLDKYSMVLTRYNVVAILRIRSASGVIDDKQADIILKKIMIGIDQKLIKAAK